MSYWSRTGGPLMWRHYDPRVVRSELDALREHGMTHTRSFFYWPDFMPTLWMSSWWRLCATSWMHIRSRGMSSIPTFLGARAGTCGSSPLAMRGTPRSSPGYPALLGHAVGAGRWVLYTYPLEHMVAQTPAVNPEPSWRLYSALAELAGAAPHCLPSGCSRSPERKASRPPPTVPSRSHGSAFASRS